jgi:hypothetical protein
MSWCTIFRGCLAELSCAIIKETNRKNYSPQLLFTCRSAVNNFLQLSNGIIDLLLYRRRAAGI